MIAGFRKEIRPMLRLAAPLAMAELGWMSMGFVDTVMAGRLGAAAIGAGSLGGMLFYPIAICGTGMLAGMDTLVAQAFGARDDAACRRTLVQGVWIALGVAPIVALLLALTIPVVARHRHQPARHGAARAVRSRAALGRTARCSSTPPSAATCRR